MSASLTARTVLYPEGHPTTGQQINGGQTAGSRLELLGSTQTNRGNIDLQDGLLDLYKPTSTTATTAATWNGVLVTPGTFTLSGTTTVTELAAARITQPTITNAAAGTVTTVATLAINDAPAAGGSATLTNAYALWVKAGTVNFAGNAIIGGATKAVGFFASTGATKIAVTGAKSNTTALGALLVALSTNYGLITDSTT